MHYLHCIRATILTITICMFIMHANKLLAHWLSLTISSEPTGFEPFGGRSIVSHLKKFLVCLMSKHRSKVSLDRSLMDYGVIV
jgi:hypothetical protein